MNFNASRNVNQPGGIRKAKRVSDVAAVGAPSATPIFNPSFNSAPYDPNSQFAEGILMDNVAAYNPNEAPGQYNYGERYAPNTMAPESQMRPIQPAMQMGSIPPSMQMGPIPPSMQMGSIPSPMQMGSIPSPMQLGSMLQQPVVQDMALQYGGQLAAQGREVVRRQLDTYVPVSRLRYYFAVDTHYVTKKLFLLLFPFTHKDWVVKYNQDCPVQPRYDVNAPDLYIPYMGYITYVLLAGYLLGLQQRFSPELLGIHASSALAYIIFEIIMYLMTLYITNTTTHLKTLDLVAFSGYKYIIMLASLAAGLLFHKTGYYTILLYTSFTLSYFLVNTLRVQVLSGSNVRDPTYGYSDNPYAENWVKAGSSSGGTKRRVYFLLFVALAQPVLTWWLTYDLVPSRAIISSINNPPVIPTL